MDKSIIPECYGDTLLLQKLVPPIEEGYNHQHSCYKVEAAMRKIGGFAVGIIDKDKKSIQYLAEFEMKKVVDDSLVLWRHKNPQKHHWIIQISPALESWILKVCEQEQINVDFLGMNKLNGLKELTKSQIRLNDSRVDKIFSEIVRVNENELVRTLTNWVKELRDLNYKVDLNKLLNV